ncbi:MAG: acyltransferase family protein, partial [Christensenellaceae bacterium]
MEQIVKRQRDSNFELLRIICCLLIVFHHWSYRSGLPIDCTVYSASRFIGEFLMFGGKIACNCFVLISGYFMIQSRFSLSKILRLWCEVFFYSVGIYLFAVVLQRESFSLLGLLYYALPVTMNQYWFIRAYLLLYLLVPVLNLAVNRCPRRILAITTGTLLALITFGSTLLDLLSTSSLVGGTIGYSVELWFIVLYFVGGYLRLYPDKFSHRSGSYFLFGGGCVLVIWASFLLFDELRKNGIANIYTYTLMGESTITGFLCSFFFFLAFKNWKIGSCRAINFLASSSLGVYLISEHPLSRDRIWQRIFPSALYYDTPRFIL